MAKRCIVIAILVLMAAACATQTAYQTYLNAEMEFESLVNQYEVWYHGADPVTQAQWRESIDPLILEGDRILDEWHNIMLVSGDTTMVMQALKNLKTRILMELAKYNQD